MKLLTSSILIMTASSLAAAYNATPKKPNREMVSRRNVMATAGAAMLVGLGGGPRLAAAEEGDVLTPLYFGVGVSMLGRLHSC